MHDRPGRLSARMSTRYARPLMVAVSLARLIDPDLDSPANIRDPYIRSGVDAILPLYPLWMRHFPPSDEDSLSLFSAGTPSFTEL